MPYFHITKSDFVKCVRRASKFLLLHTLSTEYYKGTDTSDVAGNEIGEVAGNYSPSEEFKFLTVVSPKMAVF